MKMKIILFLLFIALVESSTYYVRLDGGNRTSDRAIGECNGLADAPYPGKGLVNQSCAFNDIRWLWSKGVYCDGTPGCWSWVGGEPGDTYIIYPNPNGWRVGNNCSDQSDYTCYYVGIAGNPYASGAPSFPSGTPSNPTRLLGSNWQNCNESSMTEIFAGYQTTALEFAFSSNFQVACLDLTDHNDCGSYAPAAHVCPKTNPDISDWGACGLHTNANTTNGTFTNLKIHGFAGAGLCGPLGDNVNFTRLRILGNSVAGWNADDGSGQGYGTQRFDQFQILGSGCCEMYPVPANLEYPYTYCTDQSHGGYGDAIGTPTVPITEPWTLYFTNGEIAFSTQDGFDLLHLADPGTVIIDNCISYSNMGQQFKLGASGILRNSIGYNNPAAMASQIPGFPVGFNDFLGDFGRANKAGVVMDVTPGNPVLIMGNTFASAGNIDVSIAYSVTGCTNATCSVQYINNINVEYSCDPSHGWVGAATACNGEQSNAMYPYNDADGDDVTGAMFAFQYSVNDHNMKVNSSNPCPETLVHETNAICETHPGWQNETFAWWGVGNITIVSGSAAIGAGVNIVKTWAFDANVVNTDIDFYGNKRSDPPTLGALEHGVPFVGFKRWWVDPSATYPPTPSSSSTSTSSKASSTSASTSTGTSSKASSTSTSTSTKGSSSSQANSGVCLSFIMSLFAVVLFVL